MSGEFRLRYSEVSLFVCIGETSLHIAIVNGDLESVKLLVKYYGADVHARATGTFFLPEDCKKHIHMNSNYEGW